MGRSPVHIVSIAILLSVASCKSRSPSAGAIDDDMARALSLYDAGKRDEARDLFEDINRRAPGNGIVLDYLSELYAREANLDMLRIAEMTAELQARGDGLVGTDDVRKILDVVPEYAEERETFLLRAIDLYRQAVAAGAGDILYSNLFYARLIYVVFLLKNLVQPFLQPNLSSLELVKKLIILLEIVDHRYLTKIRDQVLLLLELVPKMPKRARKIAEKFAERVHLKIAEGRVRGERIKSDSKAFVADLEAQVDGHLERLLLKRQEFLVAFGLKKKEAQELLARKKAEGLTARETLRDLFSRRIVRARLDALGFGQETIDRMLRELAPPRR